MEFKGLKIVYFAILILLLFTNLGNQYLWQDEAQTCLISKTILENGFPYGTDGTNFFSQELGAEYGENYIWKWHTWLPFYVQALFFWLFGTSNFVARLPFALFGIGSLIYSYLFARIIFNKDTAVLTTVLLITNVGFLVLSRQARLYSPSIMFTAASLYYFLYIKDGKLKNRLHDLWFILATSFLFHTHYFYYATFFMSIGLYLLLFERNMIQRFIVPTAISGAINLPWMIWFRDIGYTDQYGFNFNKYMFWRFLKSYSYSAYKNIIGEWMFLILILVAIILMTIHRKNILDALLKLISPIALMVIFISVTLLFLCVFTPVEHFRYLSVIYPVAMVLIAYILQKVIKKNKFVGIALLLGFLYINRADRFLYEITHDYNGPLEGICKYLNDNASPDDVVLITYGDLPVKWYTGLKTYGGLTGENLSNVNPNWIISRKHTVCEKDQAVKAFIDNRVDLSKYTKIILDYPDYKFENREDPLIRIFGDAKEENVMIWKKADT